MMNDVVNEKVTKTENMSVDCDTAAENGFENIQSTKNEKTFTQSQLEEIISERLSRERRVNESLSDVKKLLKGAAQKGLLKGTSYAEMARELVSKLSEETEGAVEKNTREHTEVPEKTVSETEEAAFSEDDRVGEQNQENVGIPEDENFAAADAKEHDAQSGTVSDSTLSKESTQRKEEGDVMKGFFEILSEIREKHGKEGVEKLMQAELFESFAKGRSGSIGDIFSDFCSFMDALGTGNAAADKTEAQGDRIDSDFSSTAFSAHSASTVSAKDSLTKQQMEIARSAGMSYREYAELLGSIPSGKRGTKNN